MARGGSVAGNVATPDHHLFRFSRLGATAAALVAVMLVPAADAFADEGSADAGGPDRTDATAATDTGNPASLEEVVVTARRRNESLSRVPAAITAFNSEQLVERSIRTDADLQLVAPGLTIRQTQGNNSLTYSIRGQTADTFSGSPTAVVTYLNEVPLSINGASTFFDLESVQVLKGPQGTLFGRNATGGAVLYTSAKPTNETALQIRGRVGNLDLREADGMVNVPLVDGKLMLRAAFDIIDRDGYIDNLFDNSSLGQIRRQSGRLSLTFRPIAGLDNTFMFQYDHTDGTNTGASYTYSVYPCGATNNGFKLTCSSGLLFGPTLDLVFGPGAWASYLAAHPKTYAPGLLAYVNEQHRLGFYNTDHPAGAVHRGLDWMATNTTTFDITSNVQLKNILGVSKSTTDSQQPQLGAPFVTILTSNLASGELGNQLGIHSISEEPQLQGKAFGGKLTYIAGVYVQRLKTDTVWPQTYFDLEPVLAPICVTNAFRIWNKTDAVYAQGTYDLASLTGVENLRFTAGARYTRERVSIEQLPQATFTYGAPGQSKTFQDPSWEFGLEYQATPSLFGYLKTRGSFRSGGFNGAAPPKNADATGGGDIFDSEHTQDVEAGVKFRGSAFGRPVTLNVDVYNQWIQDVQRVEFPPDPTGVSASIAVTANVPSAMVRGIEFESSIMPVPWLQVGASGSFTDARYTNGRIKLFGQPYVYGPLADTPRTSGVFFAQVDLLSRGGIGAFNLRGEVYAQSGQYFSNAADSIAPDTRLPGYALLNGRLGWTDIMGSGVAAALYGRNLLDRAHFVGGMTLAAALGHNAADVGEPRTYGLEISYRF
jgi:iron complex outermembrane receptor protein